MATLTLSLIDRGLTLMNFGASALQVRLVVFAKYFALFVVLLGAFVEIPALFLFLSGREGLGGRDGVVRGLYVIPAASVGAAALIALLSKSGDSHARD